jgi:hypothetical protein
LDRIVAADTIVIKIVDRQLVLTSPSVSCAHDGVWVVRRMIFSARRGRQLNGYGDLTDAPWFSSLRMDCLLGVLVPRRLRCRSRRAARRVGS